VDSLLILTGVEFEARALARALALHRQPSFPFPAFGRDSIRVAPVGLAAALCDARWADLMEGLGRPLVISAGLCGGLDPRLKAAHLVIPSAVLGPSGARQDVDTAASRAAAASAGATACTGLLITARAVMTTPEAKASLFAQTGAVAVDMESAFIMARAAASGCPALVIRAISDSAEESVPTALIRLLDRDGGLRLRHAVTLTLSRPAALPRALALRRRADEALRELARVLAAAFL
jgi:adenosylhomocysteine nucleosidase